MTHYHKVGQFVYNKVGQFVVITKWADFITKWADFITKWDSFCYYKVGRFYYKVGRVLQSGTILLQSGTGITKWDDYYKVGFNTPTCGDLKFRFVTISDLDRVTWVPYVTNVNKR